MTGELTRRDILKAHAAGIAAAAAGIALPASAQPVPGGVDALQIKWSKAPCRFCGTGCGVMVGVKEGQVVATHGDMQAEVNRGLNCIKGYFLSKIMYGADRLKTPNRCLSCHKRELTQESGAPMISVTHYMTREGQMLADVSPRRYFCTACHVPQADVRPLVGNTFRDMSEMGVKHAGSE